MVTVGRLLCVLTVVGRVLVDLCVLGIICNLAKTNQQQVPVTIGNTLICNLYSLEFVNKK